MRDVHNRVSRKMIRKKATEIYPSVSDGRQLCVVNIEWMTLHVSVLQRADTSSPTTMEQKDSDLLTERLVLLQSFINF